MKIVYDLEEQNLNKKCYILHDDDSKTFCYHWDIKVSTEPDSKGGSPIIFKKWETEKEAMT